jgi:hypothetical protein
VAVGGPVPRDLPARRGGVTWGSTPCSPAGSSAAI